MSLRLYSLHMVQSVSVMSVICSWFPFIDGLQLSWNCECGMVALIISDYLPSWRHCTRHVCSNMQRKHLTHSNTPHHMLNPHVHSLHVSLLHTASLLAKRVPERDLLQDLQYGQSVQIRQLDKSTCTFS
jgi:hypothetical protein